jgi:hypothetical protein
MIRAIAASQVFISLKNAATATQTEPKKRSQRSEKKDPEKIRVKNRD